MAALSSRYHGVRLNRRTRRWEAYIRVGGKHVHLGCHSSEVTAAQVYDQAAILRHAHTLSALGPAETARLHPLVTNFAPEFYQALLAGGGTPDDAGGTAVDGGCRDKNGGGSGAARGEQATGSADGAAPDSIAQLGASHFQQLETKFAQALLERCREVGAAELAPGAENLPPPLPAVGQGGASQQGAAAPDSQQQRQAQSEQQEQLAGTGGSLAAASGQAQAGDWGEEEAAAATGLLPLEWLFVMQAAMGGPAPPHPSRSAASEDPSGPYLLGHEAAGCGGGSGEVQQCNLGQPGQLESPLRSGSLRRHMRADPQAGAAAPLPASSQNK